jgi:very-long-chain (3R)-3-hydroxyacyl-CoA dehydratase
MHEFQAQAHNGRYTMFYPLYPIGIGAEWWLMYKSIEPVGKVSPVLPPVFYFLLALYVPGGSRVHDMIFL